MDPVGSPKKATAMVSEPMSSPNHVVATGNRHQAARAARSEQGDADHRHGHTQIPDGDKDRLVAPPLLDVPDPSKRVRQKFRALMVEAHL